MADFGVRRSVFENSAEQSEFRALKSRWSPPYRLYAQLPLSKLFTAAPADATRAEQESFWKADVDYTVCDDEYGPMLSAEFDGIRGDAPNGPHRNSDLDFKMSLAKRANYPFVIVSFEETTTLERGEPLRILDDIIATVLTRRRERALIQELLREHREAHGEPDDEDIQTIVTDAGTLARLEVDPFESESSKLEFDLSRRFGMLQNVEVQQYSIPPAPELSGEWMSGEFLASVRARLEAFKAANRHGARVVITLGDNYAAITRNVSLRALDDWSTSRALSERIAKYLALKHAYAMVTANE